jgi:hypothetical protein
MSLERRVAPRRDIFRIGEIWPDDSPQPINCLVRNSSTTGALIEVAWTGPVPDRFRLTVERIGLDKPCCVVRRTTHMLGVAFSV